MVELGFALPQTGRHVTPEAIVRFAGEAERMGYASLWAFERLLRPLAPHSTYGGGTDGLMPAHYASVLDPFETLAFAAAHTARVALGTSCVVALFHSPPALARRFATLDRLSGGRAIAGIGQGGGHEFVAAGVPPTRRGAGFEEHVAAMRACWGPDPVSFEGRFYRVPTSEVGPKPVQPDGPPVLFAANAPAALERAGRVADGINPGGGTWESLRQRVELFQRAAEAAGRDPARLRVVLRQNRRIAAEPLPEPRPPLAGSPEQIASDLPRLRALGVTDGLIDMQSADLPVDDQLELMARLRRHIA